MMLTPDEQNYYDYWAGDVASNSTPTVDYHPPGVDVPPATNGHPWTDPDNAPPSWLYDPNATPPQLNEPGIYWRWNGSMWETASAPRASAPSASAAPSTNYDKIPMGTGGGGGFNFQPDNSGFAWPKFNAPNYAQGPKMEAPPAFSFDAFKAPDFNAIHDDPSYAGRAKEGMQAINNAAAAKGLTRLPATLKALAGWNQDFASREYGNIFDRAANTYNINRNNAADAYSTNYNIARDVWDRNEAANLNAFDRNYRSAYDAFNFNEWKPAELTFNDMRDRYLGGLNAVSGLD